jgi:hypothetical protein
MSSLDDAHRRYRRLRQLLDHARQDGRNRKEQGIAGRLGILAPGDRTDDPIAAVDAAFDELERLVECAAFLDLVFAFEVAFRSRFKTLVGEARNAVRGAVKAPVPLWSLRERTVIDPDDVQTLGAIERLIAGQVENDHVEGLRRIRELRNDLAHAQVWNHPLRIGIDEAREKLREISNAIG